MTSTCFVSGKTCKIGSVLVLVLPTVC